MILYPSSILFPCHNTCIQAEYLNIRIWCKDSSVEADDVSDAGDEDGDPRLCHGVPQPVLHSGLGVSPVPRVQDHKCIVQT